MRSIKLAVAQNLVGVALLFFGFSDVSSNEKMIACEKFVKEESLTLIKDSQKTKRSFVGCELDSLNEPVVVLKVEYKKPADNNYNKQRAEILGAAVNSARATCPHLAGPLRLFSIRIEFWRGSEFMIASTVSLRSCVGLTASGGSKDNNVEIISTKDHELIQQLVAVETLGLEEFLRTMALAVSSKVGQQVSPIAVIDAAVSSKNGLVYDYKILAPKAALRLEMTGELIKRELHSTCNDPGMKLLVGVFDITFQKNFLDSEGEPVFSVQASRENCRRIWN